LKVIYVTSLIGSVLFCGNVHDSSWCLVLLFLLNFVAFVFVADCSVWFCWILNICYF